MRPFINANGLGLQPGPNSNSITSLDWAPTQAQGTHLFNTARSLKRILPSINMPGLSFFSSPMSIMGKPKPVINTNSITAQGVPLHLGSSLRRDLHQQRRRGEGRGGGFVTAELLLMGFSS